MRRATLKELLTVRFTRRLQILWSLSKSEPDVSLALEGVESSSVCDVCASFRPVRLLGNFRFGSCRWRVCGFDAVISPGIRSLFVTSLFSTRASTSISALACLRRIQERNKCLSLARSTWVRTRVRTLTGTCLEGISTPQGTDCRLEE
jgi:hypothetical protein